MELCPKCQQGEVRDEGCGICRWHPECDEPSHHVPDGGEAFVIGGSE